MDHLAVYSSASSYPWLGKSSPLTFNQRLYRYLQNGLANRDHHRLDNPTCCLSTIADKSLVLCETKATKENAWDR